MKRKLLTAAAAAATLITISGGSVFASPVDFSGNIVIENRQEKMGGVEQNGTKQIFRLNAKTKISDNFEVYARFGAEGLSNASVGKDFNKSGTFAGEIDQYGVIFKNDGFTYKLGRQDLFLGSGLLFDYTANIGKNYMLDGLTISGKSGETSLFAAILQEDNVGGNDNRIYALRAGYSPAKDLTVGATLAKYDNVTNVADVNFWAIDAGYTAGKASFYGDYAKSNASTNNSAYSLGVNYNLDSKHSISLYNYRVEANASINGWTTWWSNEKGYWYTYSYKVDKNTTFGLAMRNGTQIDNDKGKKSFRTSVTYKF